MKFIHVQKYGQKIKVKLNFLKAKGESILK